MQPHKIVSEQEWIEASRALLAEEKFLMKQQDLLAEKRRALPWVRVGKDYRFDGPDGPVSLADLFDGRSQLIVYHFMYGPNAETGCSGCSFLADHFDAARQHFQHRDISLAVASRGPLDKLQAFRRRMGWTFTWVSSANTSFNYDYHVSFSDDELATGKHIYNFTESPNNPAGQGTEAPGLSVFCKDADGAIYHTYSVYARGLETFLNAYRFIDVTPKGRDEGEGGNMNKWLRRHDEYQDDGRTQKSCCAA